MIPCARDNMCKEKPFLIYSVFPKRKEYIHYKFTEFVLEVH
jgi:hypothetical protein